ncbi:MAG: transcriptional repressor LexA [Candidatus Omnitrophica bacterium]|nr:transcriptional repressor LexA [Candidatus Omnitrophota bacterium]
MTLTKRQKQVLDFIKSFIKKYDYAPSLEEVKKHLGLASVSTAHFHVQTLQQKGFLRKDDNRPRAIEISKNGGANVREIQLAGTIAAGQPIEAIEGHDTIQVPALLVPNKGRKYFALKVKGDSLIEDGILDGDVVIAEQTSTAKNGDLVVALTENHEATLKYFYKEKSRIRLEPRNRALKPLFLKTCMVRGRFVSLLRGI